MYIFYILGGCDRIFFLKRESHELKKSRTVSLWEQGICKRENIDRKNIDFLLYGGLGLTLNLSSSSSASEGPRSSIFWLRRPVSKSLRSTFSTSWPLRYLVRSSHAASQLRNLGEWSRAFQHRSTLYMLFCILYRRKYRLFPANIMWWV